MGCQLLLWETSQCLILEIFVNFLVAEHLDFLMVVVCSQVSWQFLSQLEVGVDFSVYPI